MQSYEEDILEEEKAEASTPKEVVDVQRRGNPYLGNWKKMTTYPWGLTEKEVVSLLSFLEAGMNGEKYPYHYAVTKSGLGDRMKLFKYEQEKPKEFNRKCFNKLKYLMIVFTWHPGLLTKEISDLINNNLDLSRLMKKKEYKVVTSGSDAIIVKKDDLEITPLVQEQALKDTIMEGMMDKLGLMIEAMTPQKIAKANLGTLTKSFENIMKGYLMFKDEVGPKNMTQINIGVMNLQQKKELSLKLGQSKRT